jgi:CheY-like chemotaxis protein
MADIGQIEQVLMNFATNARDAMPDGGVITIATDIVTLEKGAFKADGPEELGQYARVSFSDTGQGIDDQTKERIFDPFFTTKEVGRGTGLGLSMIYGIIKQHQGFIDVSSTPGQGTTFSVYLPFIRSEVEEQEESVVVEAPKGGTETILIAEDDEGVRILSKDVLGRAGYTLIEAADGEEAIERFGEYEEEIHLLLLDVIMPKKNGKEVYEAARKVRPDVKALFISGYTSEIMSTQGMIEKDINFVGKPVSPDTLLRKVREALDS